MFFGSRQLARDSLCCSFDLELPLEVDDEYWIDEDPQLAFRQPPGKPSIVAAFNRFIKLSQMMAFTIRTIVSSRPLHFKFDYSHALSIA